MGIGESCLSKCYHSFSHTFFFSDSSKASLYKLKSSLWGFFPHLPSNADSGLNMFYLEKEDCYKLQCRKKASCGHSQPLSSCHALQDGPKPETAGIPNVFFNEEGFGEQYTDSNS